MKIKVTFKHSKKSKTYSMSPAWYHIDKDCSTGPVLRKGEEASMIIDVKDRDEIVLSSSEFKDEFDFYHKRRGKVLNMEPKKRGKK